MKKKYTLFAFILFCALGIAAGAWGQTTPVPKDTLKSLVPLYNAGFDVIIKKNGDIIYGLVQEVGLHLIKYQRTDIPNGPIYTIPRQEVYAISYRNQVKEYLEDGYEDEPWNGPRRPYRRYDYKTARTDFFQDGILRFALGFIRTYTKVKNAGDYSSAASFPFINIGYDVYYRNQTRLGAQLAFGSHKFSGQEYSNYDSTHSIIAVKENVFTLHLYGRYNFLNRTSAFQPYILAGLGISTSNIHTDFDISFINNPGKVVQVKSGARSVGVGVLARVGADYFFSDQLSVFGDVGAGPALINIGVAAGIH